MSLTHEQRYLLEELKLYFVRAESLAVKAGIDLAALTSSYSETALSDIDADKGTIEEKAKQRKLVFEDTFKKEKAANKSH